ncbi:MAG: Eco57I restriction-modification methylase domain-containing protein [Bacteroidia bacterium]|nr:Eco57I restriction-modification methylase domain-containing protein [Bacteroidia bacterium]
MNQKNHSSDSYNPDVLTCLANLSNDEVFTPPSLVNNMLDLLPQELWSNPDAKFLDPVTKSGVFLREIAKRLMTGLEKKIPNKQKRINHIFEKQLYGIAITELTALLSRRSVYCSKTANGKYSICETFKDAQGNIRYERMQHTWENGKCTQCGASQEVYERGDEAESYAYNFIHTENPNKLFKQKNMKFDVIIGNPPYQLTVGVEKDNYSIPLYHLFVEQAKKLNPKYLTMIVPSRWFAGGRGLDDFRNEMLNDNRMRIIYDYPEAIDCFTGTQIKGGVCYFLWDRDNPGLCKVTTNLNGKESASMERPLLEKGADTFIRYNDSISILHKVKNQSNRFLDEIVSPQTPFGFVTSFKGYKKSKSNSVKIYISGGCNYVPIKSINKGKELINKYKVFIAKAGSGSDKFPHTILGQPFVGEPNSISNQTYLVIGPLKSENECKNLIKYINTRFFRFMVLLKKNTQDAMRGTYGFVPFLDLNEEWTDEKLYKKYGLTKEEIAFIESMIRPMENSQHQDFQD